MGNGERRCRYFGPIHAIIFTPVATVSTKSHATHSNVRMSKPGGPATMPVNIICPSHFAQGGRSIALRLGSSEMSVCGMMLPLALGGNATLSTTDVLIDPTRIHRRLNRCPILINVQNKFESWLYLKSARKESSDIVAA
jgi:hypothetical protein